jgi:predicted metal-binding protein
MSGCDRACTVALSAAGKPSYLFGDKRPDAETARAVLDLARLYAESATGDLPRRDRPEPFRRGILARIPG